MRNVFSSLVFILLTFIPFAVFAGNVDPDNNGNSFAQFQSNSSQINFNCDNCDVEVTSTTVTGYAWGENAGWINLQPSSGTHGVFNDGSGNLSGYAWGENAGWINFNPTYGGVKIVNGFFEGFAWSENYGWIVFDCNISGACLETSWTSSSGGGGGGSTGGGSVNPPQQQEGCTNPLAINYDPQAVVNDGSCMYSPAITGCTIPAALNYNSAAVIDDNSCLFSETQPEFPTQKPEEKPDDQNPYWPPVNPTDPSEPFDPGENNNENNQTPTSPSDTTGNSLIDTGKDWANNLFQVLGSLIKGDTTKLAKVLPTVLLALSLLMLPFQQLLQAPLRATQLLLSWFGMNKKTWGVVFDSITKQPLDPVVVSLKDITGKVIQTSITDMEGRFGFVAPEGLYTLEAHKADYLFPSFNLKDKNSDGIYTDLYFGGTFQVLNQGDIITKNIPLDPINFNWNEFEKARQGLVAGSIRKQRIHKYSNMVFFAGAIFSVVALTISQNIWNYVILGLYAVVLILRALGFPRRSGSVKRSGVPFAFGIMRIYSKTLDKEMKKVVLDDMGKYYCLIKNGEYYVTFEKRNQDGTYTPVHTSQSFHVRGGSIKKIFTI